MTPAIPDKIKGFRSKAINGLIDAVQSTQVLDSNSLAISRGPNGIQIETKDRNRINIRDVRNHFRCEQGGDKVTVRCGRWSNQPASILCDKGATGAVTGTSENYADTFDVTGISANGWIIALRDEGAGTVTPTFTATYPSAAQIGLTHFPLCRVEWNSSYSYIEKLEPIWYGGDIVTGKVLQ